MTDDDMEKLVRFDTDRLERIGLTEAILANVKKDLTLVIC